MISVEKLISTLQGMVERGEVQEDAKVIFADFECNVSYVYEVVVDSDGDIMLKG